MSWQQRVDDALTARRATDTLRRRYVVSHVMFGGITHTPAVNLCRKLV
ncbi:hypothetical protein HIN51_16020, partial [Salmonella enterica subsp. enterica serovar Dublin]|nr:hypothetical protein [Salmonella enterica subsp. enterica serovar Dublin]